MVKINTSYSNLFKLQEKKLSTDEAVKIYEDIFSSMEKNNRIDVNHNNCDQFDGEDFFYISLNELKEVLKRSVTVQNIDEEIAEYIIGHGEFLSHLSDLDRRLI